ncbi:MAG: leucyl aminopeptidase family protein [Actinomycetota bacterium]
MVDIPALPELHLSREDPLACTRAGGALALLLAKDDDPAEISRAYRVDLAAVARAKGIGLSRTSHSIELPPLLDDDPWAGLPRTVALLGIGDGDPADLRAAGLAAGRAARGLPHLTVAPRRTLDPAQGIALAEGVMLASHRMPHREDDAAKAPCPAVTICGEVFDLPRLRAAMWGTFLARTLAAIPSNTKDPQWFAEQCVALAAAEGNDLLSVEVHDESWLADNGLGAVLAVGRGSASPPRFVTIRHDGNPGDPAVLVGKGITFDTGGLSLKPREAMVPMKTDMSGAAVVLATVLAVARAGLPVHVVGVLPLAENAIGAASYRPGDIVRTHDGTMVEIRNTDAEGRMVLADALSWARAEYRPRVILDVATLTGAATLGLGRGHAALFASDESLAASLAAAGSTHGEELWTMPLVEDYRESLCSGVADVAHIATNDHVKAGAIVAALFLQRFAGDIPWAHLDIAGPGRSASATPELGSQAGTGFGVRALVEWLSRQPAGQADGQRAF